ncbi:hypothetical protein OG369_35650 [Streptomyces sp. NBC_01221]|nr:hypothetical protein [Streptomyces sp. NBC_01221]MCX4792996.1 hypothetical protein [Streptomyces sp. NBC_01242]WSP60334.1 hypothetical protein OG306_37905 [Streptomyces sp. NBC_01241]WSP67191.1 hypothetical protein OG466_02515 [Streptomyces sp. NBC_01240]WSU26283.1 hypothetical protein OG508_02475 [Streptomyces sp. NBC_01108]
MLCAAATLAVAAVPASASARPASPARAVAVDCFSNSQVRPGDFLIACGDGNNRLITLRWTQWGPMSAVGSGLDAVNDCQPYCAAGKFHTYPVEVRLDRPQSWQKHPDLQHFTRLQLVYTDSTPAQTHRVVTYKLWD